MNTATLLNRYSFVDIQDQRLVSADPGETPEFGISPEDNFATIVDKSSIGETVSIEAAKKSWVKVTPKFTDKPPAIWEQITQSWEGRVIYNNQEAKEFAAIISDRTNKLNPDEEVVIGYDSVLESDRELISEGAVFFWNFGRYRIYSKSTGKMCESRKKFEIRFRRLPPISPEKAKSIIEESNRIAVKFHGN